MHGRDDLHASAVNTVAVMLRSIQIESADGVLMGCLGVSIASSASWARLGTDEGAGERGAIVGCVGTNDR